MHGELDSSAESVNLGPVKDILQTEISRRDLLGLNYLGAQVSIPEACPPVLTWRKRLLGIGFAALTIVGMTAEGTQSEANATCPDGDVSCILYAGGASTAEVMVEEPTTTTAVPSTTTAPETTVPPTTVTPLTLPPTTLPPAHEPTIEAATNPERRGASPEIIAAIEAMDLTLQGYQAMFSSIDLSWYDYAQNTVIFNPSLVSDPDHAGDEAIPQNPTEWITAHFTASYTNPVEAGTNTEPVGEMQVGRLIDFQVSRGAPCCGFNFVIDRNGKIFQLAPYWAKLRHNPPYDGRTTGMEIEAYVEQQITTLQLERIAYLEIAMEINEILAGTQLSSEPFRGHGSMRDDLRESGNHRWDIRNDFDAEVMGLLIAKINNFKAANPTIAEYTQQLR